MNCSNFAILFKHKRELSEGDIESGREETPSQGNTIERRVKKLEFDLKCILMILFVLSFCQIFDYICERQFYMYESIQETGRRQLRIFGHHHHHVARYGYCYIHDVCQGTNGTKERSMNIIMTQGIGFGLEKNDPEGSNCPTLQSLSSLYNYHYHEEMDCKNSSYGCCQIDSICDLHSNNSGFTFQIAKKNEEGTNCPTIYDLRDAHASYYPSQNFFIRNSLYLIICLIILCICISKSDCTIKRPKYGQIVQTGRV